MGRRPLTIGFAMLALVPATAVAAGFPKSFAPMPHNPADRLADSPIENYRYDHAKRCTRSPRAGTVGLQRWLSAHARGQSWGIMRCEKLSRRNYSLHSEGRALDWHLDARVPADKRSAMNLIEMLLESDRDGNKAALARRLGVQGIIFNCRQWFGYGDSLDKYSYCFNRQGKRRKHLNRTEAHMDHVHIELNWPGARMRTSFWQSPLAD
jgi:hypothetical protein